MTPYPSFTSSERFVIAWPRRDHDIDRVKFHLRISIGEGYWEDSRE
jgi:hypothetical protein